MILKIFTIYDQKAKAYLPPFFLPERGQAIRTFTDCVNSPEHHFGKHPADYTLFELGHFTDDNAKIKPLPSPSTLGTGNEFLYDPLKFEDNNPIHVQAIKNMEERERKSNDETTIGNGAPIQPGASR